MYSFEESNDEREFLEDVKLWGKFDADGWTINQHINNSNYWMRTDDNTTYSFVNYAISMTAKAVYNVSSRIHDNEFILKMLTCHKHQF